MNELITFFTSNLSQTIGIFVMFIMLLYLGYEAHVKKVDLWDAIKGPDGKLQLPEVVMALWVVLFPVIVLSNLFLGTHPDPAVMFSMDIILAIILGVKKFKDAASVTDSLKTKTETPKSEVEEVKSETTESNTSDQK
jgi:Na+/melibiose symporter-like transporter